MDSYTIHLGPQCSCPTRTGRASLYEVRIRYLFFPIAKQILRSCSRMRKLREVRTFLTFWSRVFLRPPAVGVSWSSSPPPRGDVSAGDPRQGAAGGVPAAAHGGVPSPPPPPVLFAGGAKATRRRGVIAAAALTGLNMGRRRMPSRSDWRFLSGDVVYLRRIRSLAAFSGDLAKEAGAAPPR